MAAAFLAMNETYAKQLIPVYEVSPDEALNLDLAQARADSLKDQFVMDMHTHFLRDDTPIRSFITQRETVGKAGWNPLLVGKPQTIDDLKFPNYFKEIFLDSDTKVACFTNTCHTAFLLLAKGQVVTTIFPPLFVWADARYLTGVWCVLATTYNEDAQSCITMVDIVQA